MESKSILIIMDGWGIAEDPSVSAIACGNTPFYHDCLKRYPHIRLQASELAVGLPEGQMGNSEVGHMNIGAGRVVYQMLVRISRDLQTGAFAQFDRFRELVEYCKTKRKPLHLLGLLSDGGVHSSIEHLEGILQLLAREGVQDVQVHVFSDGRDTGPTTGLGFVKELEHTMARLKTGRIASVVGRYYAMDRDKRWERVRKAYDLLVHGKGARFDDAAAAIQASYVAGITDEFILPAVIAPEGQSATTIQPGDAVLFYNYRTDRGRELTQVLTQQDFPEQDMKRLEGLHYVTLSRYDDTFKGVAAIYEQDQIHNGLGEWLARLGKRQIRIAETEKYPHVTFFFNGGREVPMEGERHILCPSPKVATYDLQPEMSAAEIRDKIIPEIEQGSADFICLNFANPDMVGHTGVWEAAIKACETVDACTREVAMAAAEHGYKVLITADHGNADRMRNPDGSPHTAHTTALVPLILIDPKQEFTLHERLGKLGDLAPTLLTLMGLPIPPEMDGEVLVERK